MKHKEKMVVACMMCGMGIPFSVSADQVSERMARHEFNLATTSPPIDFDPIHIKTYAQKMILKSVYQTLVSTPDDRALSGDLAIWDFDWKRKAYVFHLDPKAKFYNGQPVLAEDVAWSISRHFWPSSHSTVKGLLKGLAGDLSQIKDGEIPQAITILDPHTIRFAVKGFSSSFLKKLSYSWFSILPHQSFNPLKPMSSGPMMAIQDTKDGHWALVRNPSYVGSKAQVEKINILPVASLQDMRALLDEKKVDFLDDADALSEVNLPSDFEIRKIRNARASHLFFNTKKRLFKEQDFRRDLSFFMQNAMNEFAQRHPQYQALHTYMPEGVLPATYYQGREQIALTPEAFKAKWKNKKGRIVISSLINELDQNVIETINHALHQIDLKAKWIFPGLKKVYNINMDKADLFFKKSSDLMFPYAGLHALQESFNRMDIHLDLIKLMFRKMKKAFAMQDDALRYNAYAKVFKEFENAHEIIPLLQTSFYPIVAHKALKTQIIDSQPVLWMAHWQK